jgi:hypothetical protein
MVTANFPLPLWGRPGWGLRPQHSAKMKKARLVFRIVQHRQPPTPFNETTDIAVARILMRVVLIAPASQGVSARPALKCGLRKRGKTPG